MSAYTHDIPAHLQRSIAYRITRTQRVLRKGFLELMRANGLAEVTPEQWWLLVRIESQPGAIQSQLTDALFGDRPNVTRILDRMEAQGWIARQDDLSDARCKRVALTPEGEALYQRLLGVIEAERQRLSTLLDPADVAAALRVLDALEAAHP